MDLNLNQDIANYTSFTEEEKDLFWVKFRKKHYDDTTLTDRVHIEHLSRLVKAYLEADNESKKILWYKYDSNTQKYCDYKKWQEVQQEKANMKLYFNMLIPGQNDKFYNDIVDKHYLNQQ